jgi:uncharacterized membrane protein YhaH (DUF805 family)
MNWYLEVLKKYATFEGRARRSEYWWFTLVNFLIAAALHLVGHVHLLVHLYLLAVLIPSLAVGARRLHDTNRSGWWLLIGLIPIIGAIVLLVFFVTPGVTGNNDYGADPKAGTA